jgi:hypothetical protein
MFIVFHSSISGEINVFAVAILDVECVAFLCEAGVFNEARLWLK